MKKIFVLISCVILSLTLRAGNLINVPDKNLLSYLQTNYSNLFEGDKLIEERAASFKGELNLSNKGIVSIDGLQAFDSVVKLNVSNNLIKDLSAIYKMTNLLELNCQNNKLSVLPSFYSFTKLRVLNASFNELTEIPLFSANNSLEILNVKNNKIKNFQAVGGLYALKNADLSSNFISGVWGLSLVPMLEYLDLSNNELRHIYDLNNLSNIKFLNVSLNYLYFDFFDSIKSNKAFSYFVLFPQKKFGTALHYTFDEKSNAILHLQDLFEYSKVSFVWQNKRTGILKTTTNPYLEIKNIAAADSGEYNCIINSSDPQWNNATIGTFPILVSVRNSKPVVCLDTFLYRLQVVKNQCDSISLKFETNYDTNWSLSFVTNINSFFLVDNLVLPKQNYNLIAVNSLYNCKIEKANFITESRFIPCKRDTVVQTKPTDKPTTSNSIRFTSGECEGVLSPNGDGVCDEFLFEGSGKIQIFNKVGVLINDLTLPAKWNGRDKFGQEVSPGLYILIKDDTYRENLYLMK